MRNGGSTNENDDSSFHSCLCMKGYDAPRKQRRINGFQYPLHPQQVTGWIAIIFTSMSTIFVLIPGLHPKLSMPILCAVSSLYVLHLFFNVLTTLLDPAEQELRKNKSCEIVPEFDRRKHKHVIENGRCHLCNITCTGTKTKHCSVCNKCVSSFDHHCRWLNHCIGKRNYIPFLLSVVSAVIIAMITLSTVILAFVYYLTDQNMLTIVNFDNEYNNTAENKTPVSAKEATFLTVAALLGIISLIITILLTHLFLFHMFIAYLGLTTYEYVRYQHEKNVILIKQDSNNNCFKKNLCSLRIPNKSYRDKHDLNGLELATSDENDVGNIARIPVENNYRETIINAPEDTRMFKTYTEQASNNSSQKKQKSSLCHNQVDPIYSRKQNPNNVPLSEIILSPLPLKSLSVMLKNNSRTNGMHEDNNSNLTSNLNDVSSVNATGMKKVLSPILEANNEINNFKSVA